MASQRLLSWLLLASLLFTFSDNLVASLDDQASDKVNLNLYYETLCPYCQSFIVDKLVKFFDTELDTIANLRLVPYGNAELTGINHTSISCQHGEEECYLNAIEACAIHIWPDPKKHFSFIRCVESSGKLVDEPEAAWKGCAHKFGGLKPIEDCYGTGLATQLILEYANETNSLQPPHTYVPWVTVNANPLFDKMDNFVSEVCKAYKGTDIPKPKICNSSTSAHKKLSTTLQACHAGESILHN